jgi:hypothetical protein
MEQAIDAVFIAYSEAGSTLVSEDSAAPQVTRAAAIAGLLFALGLHQRQKRSETESSNRRAELESLRGWSAR